MIKHLLLISSWFTLLYAQVDCQVYVQKFGTLSDSQASILQFTGESMIDETGSVKVKLQYSDPAFNDASYFGLILEDNKQEIDTCLYYKLWKYSSDAYTDSTEITDLKLQGDVNYSKSLRYYTFSIPQTELDIRLVKTENSNNFVYFGYYALAFYNIGETTILYNYYFQFSATVEQDTKLLIRTTFLPLNQFETKGCQANQPCDVNPSTEFKWCSDSSCNRFYTPDIFWKGKYILQQIISVEGLKGQYYLANSTLYLLGNGLCEKIVPLKLDTSVKGQINIEFIINKVWLDTLIYVVSYLADENGNLYDPMSGWTIFYHIKFSSDAIRLTCEEECVANGFSNNTCPICDLTQISMQQILKVLIMLFILLV